MSTMTISPLLPAKKQSRNVSKSPSSSVIIASNACAPSLDSGATVFVHDSTTIGGSAHPEVQSVVNGHSESQLDDEVSTRPSSQHVVKININPVRAQTKLVSTVRLNLADERPRSESSDVVLSGDNTLSTNDNSCVRICLLNNSANSSESRNNSKMVQRREQELMSTNGARSCFYFQSGLMSSGQCSPSDTLDSGTCSDLDSTPPPLPKKKNASTVLVGNGQHNRTGSLTSSGAEVDSEDDNESNVSCDSLNNDLSKRLDSQNDDNQSYAFKNRRNDDDLHTTKAMLKDIKLEDRLDFNIHTSKATSLSIDNELTEVQQPTVTWYQKKRKVNENEGTKNGTSQADLPIVKECTYEERKQQQNQLERANSMPDSVADVNSSSKYIYEDDRFYKFHLNECRNEQHSTSTEDATINDDECFAGYKILERDAIRSAKGTVRGVKNRVRAGIATFLQKPSTKDYWKKDSGKVVVYTTTMGIVRETYYACTKVKQILRTHLIKFEERDLYMSTEFQTELKERIGCTTIEVPQLFIDGQLIGDANTVERLNESGELRLMLKPYQSSTAYNTCKTCGGYRLFPCPVCNGSKKSVHRNDFTAEFIALKCMNCDEVGLVRCQNC